MSEPLVRAESLVKAFGPTTVLHGMNFTLDRGEVTCLIGPSGSGKTTFLRCINQLESYENGRLFLDGELLGYRQDGLKLMPLPDKEKVRQRLGTGMVFQQFNLFRHMTVLQNIIEAPVRVLRMPRAEAVDRARQVLARVGLAHRQESYPGQLSGGQQQRVAIARALAMRPKLLLFDEPTSALDPELVGEVLAVMRELASDGTAMIVVTHEIAFAKEVADRTVFMDGGVVVEGGPSAQLIDQPSHPRLRSFLQRLL